MCLSIKSFDKQDGERLCVDNKKRDLDSCCTNIMNKIGDHLSVEAWTVTSTLVDDSTKFCLVLFTFTTEIIVIQNSAQDGGI